MADDDAKRHIQQFERLRSQRGTLESVWQDVADHELGFRNFTTIDEIQGRRRDQRIYDDTAKQAGMILSGVLHSLLTNPAQRWMDLRYEDDRLNDDFDARVWLYQATRRIHTAFIRPASGFHKQIPEMYLDWVFFGNGVISSFDRLGRGTVYLHRHLREVYFAENADGDIDVVMRHFPMTARQAVMAYGDAVSHAAKMVESDPEARVMMLETFTRRNDPAYGVDGPDGMPWAHTVTSIDDQILVKRGGFMELPIHIARSMKDDCGPYGVGRGFLTLADAKMLNAMELTRLKAAQKAVDPPIIAEHESILSGHPRMEAGGFNVVNATTSRLSPPIQPIPINLSGFPLSSEMLADKRHQVKDGFLNRLVEMMRDPRATATQILEIAANMQRDLAPVLGSAQTDFLSPLVERTFAIEARAGRLPPPPPSIAGVPLAIEYLNPIARAQRASDAKAIIDWLTVGANLAPVNQDVMDVADIDVAYRELGESMGVPPIVMRSEEDVAAMRQAEAQVASQQQALENAKVAAETLGKGVPALQALQGGAA